MRTRLVCRRRPSRLPEDGWCCTTEYDTRLPAVCIDWAWPCSILRIQKNGYCGATRGSLGRRRSTSVTAMAVTVCSPAETSSTTLRHPVASATEHVTRG